MDRRNIVLTGFMGTGKSSVGYALAHLLERTFLDMDAWIQAQQRATIAEIFAAHGEPYFRALENALVQELAADENLVIATGGGALVNPDNRAAFANAYVICLDASVQEIVSRLNGALDRPLLAVHGKGDSADAAARLQEKRNRIQELFDARREVYSAISIHVNTNGRTPAEIARAIVARLETRRVEVNTPEGSYPIVLGHGLLDHIGEFLRDFNLTSRCAVVTNPTVGALYSERVCDALRAHGFSPTVIEIPDGEQYKQLDTLRDLYDQFIAAKLERRSPILALGGGVIGDTVGFAAATYLRGVPFVQLPTTLLSMVDSSIGGKVAVDHPSGKNLIGAFKFPLCVIQDLDTLATLPITEYRAGMAEVIKHAILADPALFYGLGKTPSAATTPEITADLLQRALQVKVDIVERDPYEQSIRAHLNLGHTFGQAIERLAGYQMQHGYAVAMGIAAAARLAANIQFCSTAVRDDILRLLRHYDLPIGIPNTYSAEQILNAMGTDKKIQHGKLRLILPRAIGHVEIVNNVPTDAILAALNESYT